MLTIIPIPSNFVPNIISNVGEVISDLSGYTTLLIGVILGVVVIEILIGALRK